MGGVLRLVAVGLSKVFTKVFGMVTVTFFGRMPSRDDDKVAAVGFLSLAWIALPLGIVVPEVAEALIPLLPDDEGVVRLVAATLTVAVPPVVGFLTTTLVNHRASGRSTVWQILKGYFYAPVIGVLVVALVLVVPVVRAGRLVQAKETKHLSMMVRDGDFAKAQEELRGAFERSDIPVETTDPHPAIWWIFRYLTWVEANIFDRDMATEMRVVLAQVGDEQVEVILHATDIAMVGKGDAVSHVMAVLSEELSEEHLYFTWDEPSQELEDRILELRHRLDEGAEVFEPEVLELRDQLRDLGLDYEEWNSLRRHLYSLERDVFKRQVTEIETSQAP